MSKLIRDGYSAKTKYEAVVLHKMTGNITGVARHLGIPLGTVQSWYRQDWWKEVEEEIRKEAKSKLGTNLQKIVDRAFEEVQDRLENGEWIYDQKQGQLKRKPIGAHTANQILKDSLDKQFFMEKLQKDEEKDTKNEEVSQRLLKLAEEFERYTKAREISTEKVMNLAIHDERTPGLCKGEPAIQVETRADPQTGVTK